MHVNYASYDIVSSLLDELLQTAIRDDSLPCIEMPYKEVESITGETLYENIDIAFYGTESFSEVGNYYLKHGVYTHLHKDFDRAQYDAFWDEEERKRKEGLTLPCALVKKDDGSYVLQDLHITGEHYGYLNYAPIKRVKKKVLIEIDRRVKLGEDISDLADDKEVSLPQFFDSDYYYFKAIELARSKGKHMVVGKSRRKGYSYKNGWLSANRADLYRNTVTGIAAYNSDSLYPEGTMTMADNYLQHISAHTDWSKRRLIDKENTIKFGYKRNDGFGVEYGFKSSILARSFATNNPGAIRGKDCTLILLEESGKNPLLSQVLASTLPTLGAGAIKTGVMIVFGTGGGDAKQWEDFEELFYSPSADGFLCFNNIWDEDARGEECGFFVPSYMGKEGFIDRHGNSNVKGAIAYEEREREIRRRAKSAKKLSDYIMEEPFCPKEAFSRGVSGIFPHKEIEEQLKRVQRDDTIKALARKGTLVRTAEGVKFNDYLFMDNKDQREFHPVITNVPLRKEDDPHGAFVMWSPPFRVKFPVGTDSLTSKKINTGEVPDNLYRIWHDPFALPKKSEDVSSRDSLGVFYVYERTNNITPSGGDRVVAEFRGRPESTNAFNDIMFAAAEYYNAVIMYENDRGDVFPYAREHKLIHRLADEPELLWQKNLQGKRGSRKKGIHINEARKLEGVIYVKDWLITKRSGNDDGDLLNLHYFYSESGLKELLKYNLHKGNFDAVSTLIVGQYDTKEQVFTKIHTKPPKTSGTGVFDRAWYGN